MNRTRYFVGNHRDLGMWIDYDVSLDQYSKSLINLLNPGKGDLVLDDGCGNGRFSIAMAEEGAEIVALDINKSMLKATAKWAEQRILERSISLVQGDIQNLPFKENAFSKLLCAHNLWYVPNYPLAVSEMLRTLKACGKVVTDHLNILNWRILRAYSIYLVMKILRQNPTPIFFRTPKEILHPFGTSTKEVYGLSLSGNDTIALAKSRASTPRLIITGLK